VQQSTDALKTRLPGAKAFASRCRGVVTLRELANQPLQTVVVVCALEGASARCEEADRPRTARPTASLDISCWWPCIGRVMHGSACPA
jgi:hypothetical protein